MCLHNVRTKVLQPVEQNIRDKEALLRERRPNGTNIITPLTSVWKMPIAYFFIDGLTADVKCNLVSEAVNRLYTVNVRVVAVVCDGPATNFAVGAKLGAALSAEDMRPFFVHPCCPDWKVYIVFDPAHMLKLMRNTLAEKGILTDDNGNQIRWQHVKDLHELQDKEGLKAANKLKRAHIEWYQQKMKVSLAAQSFSRSVANALEFVSKDLKLTKFTDVDATVRFIRIIDRLFDTLNSKSPLSTAFKSVLKATNEMHWRPFLLEAVDYLLHLKLGGIPLHQSPRKTTVLGFVATVKSVLGLFDNHVAAGSLKYLATYRLSQDHIELSFNVIRSRGRWNNNPTTGQFRAAYRQLLLKHDIKPSVTGNTVAQEDFVVLPAVDLAAGDTNKSLPSMCEAALRGAVQDSDHAYAMTVDKLMLSEFSSNVVVYVAGFVSRKLCSRLKCVACKLSLLSSSKVVANCKLIERKDAGGLVFPSHSVVVVCTTAERCLRFLCGSVSDSLPRLRNLRLRLQIAVVERTQHMKLFVNDEEKHTCNTDVFDGHAVSLTRAVLDEFIKGKRFTDHVKGKNVRFNSNKQVLFSHQ